MTEHKNKILFYFGGFAPLGGIETFGKNLLSYLQLKDYDCRLLCWGQSSPLLQSTKEAKVQIIRSPWRWGCKWNLPDWMLLPIGIYQVKLADAVLFGKLFPTKILKKLRASADKRTPFIYITPYKPLPPKTTLEKQSLLEALNLFDMIFVQSSSFIDDLHTIGYQGRIEVIPYIPHSPGKLKPFPSTEQLKIGFLGRLVEDKNLPLLLQVFRSFQDKYLGALDSRNKEKQKPSLHIFGDGHLHQELKQLVQNLNIASSVVFHGSIPNTEIEDAIASCHLFAFTSHIEGQCLAALEILGCGRPIVATDAGALPEILADSRLGRIVKPANPISFADNLMEIGNLIQQQLILPDKIRSAYLERYAPEKVGEQYSHLLNSLN